QFREVPGWTRAVSDLRVRRALMHAIDRQTMTDVVNLGLSPPADVYVAPADPLFPDVDRAVSKYPYDPNRAASLLTEAGWQRPPAPSRHHVARRQRSAPGHSRAAPAPHRSGRVRAALLFL